MRRLEPFPVAVALSFIFLILYAICIALHYVMPDLGWPMYRWWEMTLFGFTWISTLSFFLGALEIFVGGFYVGYTFVPLYNYFNHRFPAKKGEKMRPLRFKPVALAVTTFNAIAYILCIVIDLIFPQSTMYKIWEILLPGFTWISWGSFFIGLLGVIIYGIYIAAVFVPLYNNFSGTKLPEVK